MRFSLWLLGVVVALTFPLDRVCSAEEAPQFPARIGGLEFFQKTDYEKDGPGLGTGWAYRAKGIKADIYLYSGGLASISSDLTSPLVANHFQEVVAEIYEMKRRGYYSDVRTITPEKRIQVGSMPFLYAELKYTQENTPRISQAYLSVWKNQFLKIRFTFYAAEAQAGEKAVAEFVPTIVKAVEAAN